MYPQVIILGFALFNKKKNILLYSISLAVLGALVAGYSLTFLQFGVVRGSFCDALDLYGELRSKAGNELRLRYNPDDGSYRLFLIILAGVFGKLSNKN